VTEQHRDRVGRVPGDELRGGGREALDLRQRKGDVELQWRAVAAEHLRDRLADLPEALLGVDVDADGLYPVGSYRDDLERRFGRGAVYWIVNAVPADDYAAAYVKAMVSLRRPRPVAYEVFAQRSAAAGHALYYDYVFYGDGTRVLYVTRKTVN